MSKNTKKAQVLEDEFKRNSVFKSKEFEDHLDTIEEKQGLRTRKEVEGMEGNYDLEQTDKDSGPEYVAKQETEKLKQSAIKKEATIDYVASTITHESYRANLAEWGMWLLMQKDFPSRFEYHCIPTKDGDLNIYGKNFFTKEGILFVLKAPNGKVFIKAVQCSYMPKVDVNAVGLLSVEVENTVDSLKGLLLSDRKGPSKIIR
jgi:hypothetical protein